MIREFVDPNLIFIRHQTLIQSTEGLYLHKLLVDGIRCSGLLHSVETEALSHHFQSALGPGRLYGMTRMCSSVSFLRLIGGFLMELF